MPSLLPSPPAGRALLEAAVLAPLLTVLVVPILSSHGSGSLLGPVPTAAAQEPRTEPVRFPPEDEPLYRWILERYQQFPAFHELNRVQREELFRLHRLADEAQIASQYHLEHHPTSAHRPEVASMLARLLVLNQDRFLRAHQDAHKAEHGSPLPAERHAELREEYNRKLLDIVEAGLEPLRRQASLLEEIKGETLLMDGRPEEAAKAFATALDLWPDHPRKELVAANRCDALWRGELFAQAETDLLRFLEEHRHTQYWAHMFFLLNKVYRNTGRLEDGLAAWDRFGPRLRAGAAGEPATPDEQWVPEGEDRLVFRRYADREQFYRGLFTYAAGDKEAALEHWNAFLDHCEGFTRRGEPLQESTRVYLNFQAVPSINTLVSLVGRPAPALEIPPEDWISPATPRSPGQIRLLVFADVNGAAGRYAGLLRRLDELQEELGPDTLQVVWIADTRKRYVEHFQRTYEAMVQLIEHLDLDMACGLDGADTHPVYDAYTITPGTGHIFAIGPDGAVAWHVIDPLDRDIGLVRTVVERLRASGSDD